MENSKNIQYTLMSKNTNILIKLLRSTGNIRLETLNVQSVKTKENNMKYSQDNVIEMIN